MVYQGFNKYAISPKRELTLDHAENLFGGSFFQ